MKKRIITRCAVSSLIAILLFTVSVCLFSCNKDNNDDPDSSISSVSDDTEQTENKKITLISGGTSNYKIVRPENCSTGLLSAVDSICSVLKSETGSYFRQSDDYTKDGKPVESKGEIIIGNCKRTETAEVLKSVKYKDYSICITENNIIVAAHDDSTAIKGAQKLAQLLEGNISKSGEDYILDWSGDYYYSSVGYKYPDISLGGVDIKNYSIVYPSDDLMGESLSEELRALIGTMCGHVLEIVADTESERKYEILLGHTNRSGDAIERAELDMLEYVITTDGDKIIISGAYSFSTSKAIEAFGNYIISSNNGIIDGMDQKVSLLASEKFEGNKSDIRIMEYNILAEFEGWGSGGKIPPEVEVRKEIVSSVINGYKPDVICLCEVFENWRDQLPPLLDTEYEFIALNRPDGYSNITTIAYNSETLTLIEGGYDERIAITPATYTRVITWGVFEVKESGERFMVLGSHFDSESNAESIRVQQAKIMITLMNELKQKHGDIPVVLTGDFNTVEGKPGYQEFVNGTGYKDAFASEAISIVDHMFYDQSKLQLTSAIKEQGKFTEIASDHKPIIGDFKFIK